MAFEKPSRDRPSPIPRRVQHIIDNADAIFRYTEGMDRKAFADSAITIAAVERCLQRISEAAARLGDMAPHLMPGQPWEEVIALGDVLQHEFDGLEPSRLFDIVRTDLPPLRAAAQEALRQWDLFRLP